MILKEELKTVLEQQADLFESREEGVLRTKLSVAKLSKDMILIITGVRRCGKSTLQLQLRNRVQKASLQLQFEDPRLFEFDKQDFTKLDALSEGIEAFFLDEIQNVLGWESYARHLSDKKNIVCITGSNATMLSRELGSKLTGRHIQIELFPFSYEEYLRFTKKEAGIDSSKLFLEQGGFPEYLKSQNPEVIQQLFKDIIYRDIVVRQGIRNERYIMELALYLVSNIGKPYSLNGLQKLLGIGSANTVMDYVHWLEDAYLFFSLPKFSFSPKSTTVSPRKIYSIDNAMPVHLSRSFNEDWGRLLENQVFLELRKRKGELFYFKEQRECDFILRSSKKDVQCFQVCWELHSDNKEREMQGLLEAMLIFKKDMGYIITHHQEDEWLVEGKRINIVPFWKFQWE